MVLSGRGRERVLSIVVIASSAGSASCASSNQAQSKVESLLQPACNVESMIY